jgi:hypothetical protein
LTNEREKDCDAFYRGRGLDHTERVSKAAVAERPVEVSHIYNEPMFGRHIAWDDTNLKLGVDLRLDKAGGAPSMYEAVEQRTLGFYDAPVTREGLPEYAVVVFGDVDEGHALHQLDPKLLTQGVAVVLKHMERLLVKHSGYNVPQREGHFM